MHATEWAGGVAALHFVQKLLDGHGKDERITRLLDTRTIYVLPRMTPDGVDATLDQGRFIRSVDRPYPSALPQSGIIPRDLDGDGRTVFMRLRDPNGPWKAHAEDPRLLVPRAPDETGGDYWRVLREGTIEGYDGATIAGEPESWGLGGPEERMTPELDPKLRHFEGSLVAWKAPGETKSHGSQFFLTTADQSAMDGKTVVFGRVLEGESTIEAIESGAVVEDRPQDPAVIESVDVL